MTPATTPGSVIRRRSQVFVEIPPSPLHPHSLSSLTKAATHVPTGSSRHKENSLFTPDDNVMADSSTRTSPRKRKLSNISTAPNLSTSTVVPDGISQRTPKKAKVTSDAITKPKKATTSKSALKTQVSNASEEYPDGFFYCHQCNKKRDMSLAIQCTYYSSESSKHARCRARYCKICLKNRYGDSFDEIMARGENSRPKGHVKGCGYIFQCYRCRDMCNCRNCRKAKGLEPTGNLTLAAKKTGAESAAAILGENPSAKGILPGKGQQVVPEKKSAKIKVTKEKLGNPGVPTKKVENGVQKTKTKPAPKPKPVPAPTWKAVETTVDLASAEDRFLIREFLLRFATLLDIGKANLEELDDVDADFVRGSGRLADDDEEVCAWVSEPCVKAIIVGLLTVIAAEASTNTAKTIKDTMREIRNSGANLTKIWAALAILRDNVTSGPSSRAIDFPDPLPPPASATFRSTRSGVGSNVGILVAESWQLIPILLALIDTVMGGKVLKEEIDKGVEKSKELHKECREEVKKENEMWDRVKKGEAAKTQRAAHKQRVIDLEEALETALMSYLPRSGRLGKDLDGRVYWVLSPGPGEREFAQSLLSDASKAKVTKKGMLSVEDREAMRRWSWFVAVWGKKPSKEAGIPIMPKMKSEEDEEEEQDDGKEKWWGFCDPKEIKTLANWLAVKSGVESGSGSSKDQRTNSGSRHTSVSDELTKGKSRSASISVALDTDVEMEDMSRASTPLSELDDEDGELSELSDEEDERDVFAEGPPSKGSMRKLVKGLRGYADLLSWRLGKWQKLSDDEKEKDKTDSGKGKKA